MGFHRVGNDSKGQRNIRDVALLIVIAFSILIVVNAVAVRGISVAVGVGVLGAFIVVSLVVLLGAEGNARSMKGW